jgi:hypothetical protein
MSSTSIRRMELIKEIKLSITAFIYIGAYSEFIRLFDSIIDFFPKILKNYALLNFRMYIN